MNKYVKKEISLAGRKLILETGELALLSNMCVKATYGDTVVLVNVCSGPADPNKDFFPLTIIYEERLYASGNIKSSRFIKRDGRPTDDAVITKRLIDHAVRPVFPEDYGDEVQVVAMVLSLDDTCEPESLAMIATSAALHASDIPWRGPMVSARVGFVNNDYVLNPTKEDLHTKSQLDMMVSFVGNDRKFLAIEAEAHILPEEKILGAIEFARDGLESVVALINDFAHEVNPDGKKQKYVSKKLDVALVEDVSAIAKEKVLDMIRRGLDKTQMTVEQDALMEEIHAKLGEKYESAKIKAAFHEIEKHAIQQLILDEHKRPDGRGIDEIRKITTQVGVLPRTHGSAVFSRGVTQVMTVATLGSANMELFIQNMYGETTKRYIHYYNYPPYANGEVGRINGFPGSREIGHGMLAEKALKPVIPSQKDFPYMVLLVSETLSSSGSSSMAATCGSTMALMNAGVPIKHMVGGVGVGLIANDDFTKHVIMTDLAYMEDAYGFLDFKMTGTRTGVTAMQADMKLCGIPMSILPKIFEQSTIARQKVLDEMEKTISKPNAEVSKYAPKSYMVSIDPEKIGMVIGAGGRTIKEIQEKFDVEISIDDDGSVVVSGMDEAKAKEAVANVEAIVKDVKAGEIYDGTVRDIVDFGAFVEILPGKDGLLHVSEIAHGYVANVEDYLKVGDSVRVKVLEVSRDGKISLSKKALEENTNPVGAGGHMPTRPMDRNDRNHRHHDGGLGERHFRR